MPMRMPGFSAENTLHATVAQKRQKDIDLGPVTVCKCAGACVRKTICLFGYCTQVTVCDDCAYVYDCYVESAQ
jgi:hypothetical protein